MLLIIASAITVALIVERMTFAWVSLLFYLFNQGPDRKSTWFITNLVQNSISLLSSAVASIFRLFTFSITGLLYLTLILMLWGLLYVAARHSAVALVALQSAYNSNVGGAFRLALVVPIQLAELVWNGVVPVYNLLTYCVKTIPTRIQLENVLRNLPDFENAMLNLAMFIESLTMSLFDYITGIITPPDSFDPNLRLLDLITPLSYWRLVVSYVLTWLGNVCSVASSLLDILLYPFLDINFGLGVHNIVNSILTLVIQVPAVTVQRCNAGGHLTVYCLPDFEPVIELAVNGVRNFGLMVDNWLDVTSLIIQAVLTNTSPACSGWNIVDFSINSDLFGNNETTVVGVDANFFAKTDGWNIELYSRTNAQSFPSAFPSPMNVNYGIAVVTVNPGTQGLMGCACSDQAYGMQIICSVAPLDTLSSSFYVPVEFDVPSTSFFMGCGKSKIRLDSIRWPVTRYTSPNSNARSSPVAQAALYVRPACGSEQIDVVCIDTFKLASCFPYCMALWTKGNIGSIVLRGGDEWANTVSMVSRDCGLHSWDLVSGELSAVTQTLRQNSGVTSTWMNAEVQLNSSHCVYAPNTFSRMLKSTAATYTEYRSVILTGQPFAFAGDLILTAVNTVGTTWGIDVQRIWGNQVLSSSEITLLNLSKSAEGSMSSCFMRFCTGHLSANITATARRVSMGTVRFGRISSSCRASARLMSLRQARFP